MANVTGWNELLTGNITGAAYQAANVPLGGFLVIGLYLIIMFILWMRTQSVELCAIISLLFFGVFIAGPWFDTKTVWTGLVITAFFVGATIFKFIAKER